MISIIAIEVVTTTPNKIWAFVFDKMVYVLTTDLIMITDSNRNLLRIRLFVGKKEMDKKSHIEVNGNYILLSDGGNKDIEEDNC
jgi:hypothetical protein